MFKENILAGLRMSWRIYFSGASWKKEVKQQKRCQEDSSFDCYASRTITSADPITPGIDSDSMPNACSEG